MNLYESIRINHNKKVPKRSLKESAEGGKEFWDKVDAGEIKIGGTLDSNGAGDIDVLDLNKNADYILIKRNSDYQPFVAAWAPEFYNGKLTWGQGHYFDNEDDAREYFNQKALGECDKPIKEAIDMDRLRAARGRENQQTLDKENKVKDNIHNNAMEVIDVLNNYGYDNLLEVGNYLNDEGLLNQDLQNKNKLTADGWSHRFGYLNRRNEHKPITAFAIMGGGACGNVGIKFTNTKYFLMDENCETVRYNTVDEIPAELLSYYEDLADWANNGNGSVDNFINKVEAFANEYSEKYPELQESCSKKKIKEEEEPVATSNFPRTILLDRVGYDGQKDKYRFVQEYNGFGIYQERTPSGYDVHQSYMITNGKDKPLESESYNSNDLEDMLDIIDVYNSTGHYGQKIMDKGDHLIIHPSGRLDESCDKNKKPSLKESNPARYLGIKQELNEAINHANDEINAKIREALRSKTAARKYRKDLEAAGLTIDDSPREGVILIGPNGRKLSADRQTISGPMKPGHGETHGDGGYYDDKYEKGNLKKYDARIASNREKLAGLKSLGRDDIIRKYPENTTDEALEKHAKDIEREEKDLEYNRKYRRDTERDLARIHRRRDLGHKRDVSWRDHEVRKDGKTAAAIDYKGYLDSKEPEEKEYNVYGEHKPTPGQETRNEFSRLKSNANQTYYWGSDAREDLQNRAIDAKAIEARKKEIEEEYKKKMDDEVNSMLKKKSDADASYKSHKEKYAQNVNAVREFRKAHNLPDKEAPDFDTYIKKKAESRY